MEHKVLADTDMAEKVDRLLLKQVFLLYRDKCMLYQLAPEELSEVDTISIMMIAMGNRAVLRRHLIYLLTVEQGALMARFLIVIFVAIIYIMEVMDPLAQPDGIQALTLPDQLAEMEEAVHKL